jgi:glycolate oxidase iron-sulfur subunit
MESARETLADARKTSPQWLRLGLAPLTHPRLLSAGSTALAVANRAHLVPRRLGLPTDVSIRRERYAPSTTSGPRVWMFTGCVMDSWQRDVHQATKRNLEAAGFNVTPTSDLAPCCGALHAHAGLADTTRNAAVKMMQTLAGSDPIVVDSAGCGAAMKDYGHLLGTTDAAAFAARVFDAQEFIAAHLDRLPTVEALNTVVAIQDPCHLRHVQRVHMATREVLAPVVRHLVELDDEGLCCGAGGAYSLLQPEMATAIRQRKVDTIERAQADVVASANPGCSMHLAAAGVPTRHPMQILDDALRAGAGGHQ